MQYYKDQLYPPIGNNLSYLRGDGRRVTIEATIEENGIVEPAMPFDNVTPVAEREEEPDTGHKPDTNRTPNRTRGLIDLFGAPLVAAPKPDTPPLPAPTKPNTTNARVTLTRDTLVKLAERAQLSVANPKKAATQPGNGKPGQFPDLPDDVYDHEYVGGKFTICVLLYGPDKFFEMHQRCLNAIIGSVPPERMDLRVASNELNERSRSYVDELLVRQLVTKHYEHAGNDFKYPVMREMFHDPTHPIRTKWVLWFDDDSIADRTPGWLKILCQAIALHHKRDNAHLFGAACFNTPSPAARKLFESRPWHKGKPWRLQNGNPSPNGNRILFVAGGFWAITHEAIKACDIPDLGTGLTHNGGDIQIGEQLYQGGFGLKNFNAQKQFVNTSATPRRGITTPFPGGGTPKLRQLS